MSDGRVVNENNVELVIINDYEARTRWGLVDPLVVC